MGIKFTKHAEEKFETLARHKFIVTKAQVIETLASPDKVESETDPPIAQKGLNETHVLRVVYRVEGNDKIVITFYPGRKKRYED